MAKCSVKGHTINSDPNPFEYSISNRIVLVHLWSSNTDLAMFQQDFLSFSLPLSSSPSLRVSITFASTPFESLPLFQSYSQDYTLTHLYPLFFFVSFLQSILGPCLNESEGCWVIFALESRD